MSAVIEHAYGLLICDGLEETICTMKNWKLDD